jgi:malonate decarboxylase epsilon subunit
MSTAFLLPGQGSQKPGMLSQLPHHRTIVDVLDKASEVLRRDVRSMDTAEAFTSTIAVQLALLIAGVATAKALESEGARPELVAGHSIGAFGAAVISGSLQFEDALKLVKLRAEMMEQAFPSGYGMGVVLGLDERRLQAVLEEVLNGECNDEASIYLANMNAPRQFTVSGNMKGLERALAGAWKAGARKVKLLPVRVPSHCELLKPIALKLETALEKVDMQDARVQYVTNVSARALRTASSIRSDLHASLSKPVRWHDTTAICYELGVRLFIEMPPGRALSDLVQGAFPDVRVISVCASGLETARNLMLREHSGNK